MARLAFNLNNGNEFVFDLDLDHMSLGRTSENDIVIANSYISGRHCVFRRDPLSGLWEILDLNSQNGLMVNGVKVSRTQLHHGDKIALGQVEARFHLTEAAPPRSLRDGSTSRVPTGGGAAETDTSRIHRRAPAGADAPDHYPAKPPGHTAYSQVLANEAAPASSPKAQGVAPDRSHPLPQHGSGAAPTVPSSGQMGALADLAQARKDLTATRQILARRTASLQQAEGALDVARAQLEQLRAQLADRSVASEELELGLKEQSALNERLVEELAMVSAERDWLRHSLPQMELETSALEARRSLLSDELGRLTASCSIASGQLSSLGAQIGQAKDEWKRLEQEKTLASKALQEIQAEALSASELALQLADLRGQRSTPGAELSQQHQSRNLFGHSVMGSGELTAGLIRRIDLLDNLLLHASRRGDTAPELIDQIAALRSSLIDLLSEAGVEEVSVPAGTPIDIDLRRRIKIIERAESSGDESPKVLETLRPGFISALATGGDLVLRKVEVKTG